VDERREIKAMFGEPMPALRRFCSGCHHSDFVHRDPAPRECLYSECTCPGYIRVSIAADAAPARTVA
jgi:hypothetical protein